jgi:hypothetical protein
MAMLKSDYNPDDPIDVREFSRAIADMYKSGPAGVNQANRKIEELSKTDKGRKLLQKTQIRAKLAAEAFKVDLSSVKVHGGSVGGALGASAFTSGSSVHFSNSSKASETLGHELAHVVQQRQAKGDK